MVVYEITESKYPKGWLLNQAAPQFLSRVWKKSQWEKQKESQKEVEFKEGEKFKQVMIKSVQCCWNSEEEKKLKTMQLIYIPPTHTQKKPLMEIWE